MILSEKKYLKKKNTKRMQGGIRMVGQTLIAWECDRMPETYRNMLYQLELLQKASLVVN